MVNRRAENESRSGIQNGTSAAINEDIAWLSRFLIYFSINLGKVRLWSSFFGERIRKLQSVCWGAVSSASEASLDRLQVGGQCWHTMEFTFQYQLPNSRHWNSLTKERSRTQMFFRGAQPYRPAEVKQIVSNWPPVRELVCAGRFLNSFA